MQKCFLDEETLILDSFRLGTQIYASGFRPSFIVGLWRGGPWVLPLLVEERLAN